MSASKEHKPAHGGYPGEVQSTVAKTSAQIMLEQMTQDDKRAKFQVTNAYDFRNYLRARLRSMTRFGLSTTGHCEYRTPEGVPACGVGQLIDDESYTPTIERLGVQTKEVQAAVQSSFPNYKLTPRDWAMLRGIQHAHDTMATQGFAFDARLLGDVLVGAINTAQEHVA